MDLTKCYIHKQHSIPANRIINNWPISVEALKKNLTTPHSFDIKASVSAKANTSSGTIASLDIIIGLTFTALEK